MTLTQLFLAELEREAPRTRRALEQVPHDRDDWTPHPKSMPLGRLAGLVASMPSWIDLIINRDELNLTPPEGQGTYQQPATATLVTVPVPVEAELPAERLEEVLKDALTQAANENIRGRELTPFLLSRMAESSGGATLRAPAQACHRPAHPPP